MFSVKFSLFVAPATNLRLNRTDRQSEQTMDPQPSASAQHKTAVQNEELFRLLVEGVKAYAISVKPGGRIPVDGIVLGGRSIYRKNKNLFRKESLNERMRVIPAFRVTCSCLSGTATFVPIDFARVDGKFSVTGWHP
jgi:hypothetical protein